MRFYTPQECEDWLRSQTAEAGGYIGGYVLTDANYVNAFFSHDEYIDFFDRSSSNRLNTATAPTPM